MSTYTDLQNRVKENLTVNYHDRISTQKVKLLNWENHFRGVFEGVLSGVVASTDISCANIYDSLLIRPLLSVGYDAELEQPVISDLTAYIDAHGGGKVSADAEIMPGSKNPVENRAIYEAFEYVRNYITNVLGTQVSDLIDEKFRTLEQLVEEQPAEEQDVGRSAIVYDLQGNARFYTVELSGSTKVWSENPTIESMYVSKTTDVDKMPDAATTAFAAGIRPVDGTKLEQLLSNYTELNDRVPTSRLVKATAEQLSAMITEGSEGAAEWIKDHFDADQLSDVVVKGCLSAPVISACFDKVYDGCEHVLSDYLHSLNDKSTVLNVCVRVNDIIRLAALEVEPVSYESDVVQDLFDAVLGVTGEACGNFGEAVQALNDAIKRLRTPAGIPLETRLQALANDVDTVIDCVNILSGEVFERLDELSASAKTGIAQVSADLDAFKALSSTYVDKQYLTSQYTRTADMRAVLRLDTFSSLRQTLLGVFGGVSPAECTHDQVVLGLSALMDALSVF